MYSPKRRVSATVGARVVGPAVQGAGARVEQARQRAATIATRVEAGGNLTPAPMVPKLPLGPPVAEPAARYLEEHVTVRCEPGMAARCRPMCRQRAVGSNDDRAACLRVAMPSGGRLPGP